VQAGVLAQRRLQALVEPVSSSTSRACLVFWTSSIQPKNMNAPATAALTRTMTAQIAQSPAPPDGRPPFCDVPVTAATARTPTGTHGIGSAITER
jgi:hypothetical protein